MADLGVFFPFSIPVYFGRDSVTADAFGRLPYLAGLIILSGQRGNQCRLSRPLMPDEEDPAAVDGDVGLGQGLRVSVRGEAAACEDLDGNIVCKIYISLTKNIKNGVE